MKARNKANIGLLHHRQYAVPGRREQRNCDQKNEPPIDGLIQEGPVGERFEHGLFLLELGGCANLLPAHPMGMGY